MNQYLPRFLILGLLASAATAVAQTDLSYLFTSRPKYWFTAGINVRSGGPTVKFSHLGSLPRALFDTSTLSDTYDDGSVGIDTPRTDETASTTKFNADHTRYQTFNADGTVFADYLAYQGATAEHVAFTRNWIVDTASQVTNGDAVSNGGVDFHFHQASENGATGDGPGKSSGGFDLQLARDIGQVGKRGAWGIVFSIGVNDISSKYSNTVLSNSVVTTDTYSLHHQAVPTSDINNPYYSAPSPSTLAAGQGGVENTVTISQYADNSVTNIISNGAQVSGTWKIKGAYYLMRLGPSWRFYVSKRVSFSTNLGLAAAYVGSDFDIDETMIAPVLKTQPTFVGTSRKREMKLGAYAEVNAEYWITYRTGFFAGLVYEHLGKYEHTFSGAVANVDIGSGLNFRLGLITRF